MGQHDVASSSVGTSFSNLSNAVLSDTLASNTGDILQSKIFTTTERYRGLRINDAFGSRCGVLCPNASTPTPIENNLFKGKVLFFLKPMTEEDKLRHHANSLLKDSAKTLCVQVQGQFKKKPEGVVYAGGELAKKVEMGYITKSLSAICLRILQQSLSNVHINFGEDQDSHHAELPHIVFPLYQSADEFVATPIGEEPPKMGMEEFGESEEDKRVRMASCPESTDPFCTEKIYTFQFFSFYVDLFQWKAVNIPGVSFISLSTFWGTSPLRLVSYVLKSNEARHSVENKEYVMGFELDNDKSKATN